MLRVEGVSYRIDGTTVLEEIDVAVESGTFVLLVGHNGAGKTTLLDLICGIGTPTTGRILVDGHDVVTNPGPARSRIGRVFEDPRDQLLGATVREDVAFGPENLGLSRDVITNRVDDALSAVGMGDAGDRPIDSLSGGERIRVAIAGALAMNPSILLLDEPTAGLDHPGRTRVLEHVRRAYEGGVGVVMATHDLRDLDTVTDRVIGLEAGRIAMDASPITAVDHLADLGVRVPSTWSP